MSFIPAGVKRRVDFDRSIFWFENRVKLSGFTFPIVLLFIVFGLTGCIALPVEGPLSKEIIKAEADNNTAGFVIINASADLQRHIAWHHHNSLRHRFGRGRRPALDVVGSGDVLNVTVWESDPSGLFSSSGPDIASGSSRGSVNGIEVDSSGYIRFPYVGRIRASGLRPSTLSVRLRNALASKTSNPQVHVERMSSNSRHVTVAGIVAKPGPHLMALGRTSLMDALAQAGGSTKPAHESVVTVTRGASTGKIYLDRLSRTAAENINVSPRDLINVAHRPKHFLALGAVKEKGRIAFESSHMNILDGIATAQGLKDVQADPTGVFVFRYESRSTVRKLGYDRSIDGVHGKTVPVIYRFDLRNANHYFFATRFPLRADDVVFVSNARAVQVDKLLSIIGRAVGIGTSVSRESINGPAN